MLYRKKELLAAFFLTALGGLLLQFFYSVFPNLLSAVISPVQKSLWEYIKILFFPGLCSALILTWGRPCALRPWLLTLESVCLAALAAGYIYHMRLGGEEPAFDLALYLTATASLFVVAPRFSGPFQGVKWLLPIVLAILLAGLLLLFTFRAPDGVLFVDLMSVHTLYKLPC